MEDPGYVCTPDTILKIYTLKQGTSLTKNKIKWGQQPHVSRKF